MSNSRQPTYSVHDAFLERWSTISFKKIAIDKNILMSCFEAARWSPSSYNSQPWRFVYALNEEGSSWGNILATMHPLNQAWASNASALVMCLERKRWIPPKMDVEVALPWSSFDLGAACMSFSLQATMLGWHTHAVGGFDSALAIKTLEIPEPYQPKLILVVGKYDPQQSALPQDLHQRDQLTQRIDLDELVFENTFKAHSL